ncbi:hypothetical protein HU200_067843 [Digitaria exilis]|uniref:O-methyltransferase dimerisation domain-containing protein n=1 Tax=Digitaria exilis TaxID=1010633 RepID=A0A835A5C7_9POAL|nr:hypothetical protein HU200_067843 [Digitaria exilis]
MALDVRRAWHSTAIHRLGGAASPADLITALSLPSAKLPFLRRLLRLLGASGIFNVDKSTGEEILLHQPHFLPLGGWHP